MAVNTDPPFTRLLNFRDVGKTINGFVGKRLVAENILFRSARPDDITLSDRKRLREEYGIKTVMDLRTKSEHDKQAKKRKADLAIPAVLQSNDALAEPVKIPGLNYLEVNINGPGFERSLLKKLSVWGFIKLVFFMACGYRLKGISVLAREVMTPRGLIGLGYDSLDYCGPEIAQALRLFGTSSNYPILYHCTQGKDRTGLLTVLMLFLLEVPIEAITYDYTLSSKELASEREERLKEMREMGFSDDFADTPQEFVGCMRDHLESRYGGVRGYLKGIGFGEGEMDGLIEVLRG